VWRTFLIAILISLAGRRVSADGLNLAWNDCAASSAAASDVSFTCDDESRTFSLVGSFIAPGGIEHLCAEDLTVEIRSSGGDMPDWWRFDDAGCRSSSLTSGFDFSGLMGCTSPWGSAFVGASLFERFDDGPSHWRIRALCAKPVNLAGPVTPGREYGAFRLTIDAAHTLGGACGGCSEGLCLEFTSLTLEQPGTEGDFVLTTAATRSCVTWQGGGADCPGACRQQTRHSTWGRVKSTYR
jgi:hypothetical protein